MGPVNAQEKKKQDIELHSHSWRSLKSVVVFLTDCYLQLNIRILLLFKNFRIGEPFDGVIFISLDRIMVLEYNKKVVIFHK